MAAGVGGVEVLGALLAGMAGEVKGSVELERVGGGDFVFDGAGEGRITGIVLELLIGSGLLAERAVGSHDLADVES